MYKLLGTLAKQQCTWVNPQSEHSGSAKQAHVLLSRESAGPGQWNASSVVKGVHSETSGSEVSVLSSSKAGNMNTIPCIKV